MTTLLGGAVLLGVTWGCGDDDGTAPDGDAGEGGAADRGGSTSEQGGAGVGGTGARAGSGGGRGGSGGSDQSGSGGTGIGAAGAESGTGGEIGGRAGAGGAGGVGGSGGDASAGEGGAEPFECGVSGFEIVGSEACYECPGLVYLPFESSCAVYGPSHYDPVTHQLNIEFGPGLPVPVSWELFNIEPIFPSNEQRLACAGEVHGSVGADGFVLDISEFVNCEGFQEIVVAEQSVGYECSDGLHSPGEIRLVVSGDTMEGGPSCTGGPVPAPQFGRLIPLPKTPTHALVATGAIRNLMTGWIWEQRDDGDYASTTLAGAETYCSELSWAGYDDWRVPSRLELTSLLDHDGGYGLAIDPRLFVGTPSEPFWTASEAVFTTDPSTWTVEFNDGFVTPAEISSTERVRCVRAGSAPVERYQVDADVVVDRLTGLTWARASGPQGTAAMTLSRCQNLATAGGGWRAPTIGELHSIVDDTRRSGPSIDTTIFPDTQAAIYWSSTHAPNLSEFLDLRGFVLDFATGSTFVNNAAAFDEAFSLCVR